MVDFVGLRSSASSISMSIAAYKNKMTQIHI